ncbi:carboxypeptidase-like regulatory domain-containing protein [Actinomadura sp. NPDC047616]|uniref:carboxypeptidase-like regulatory domain-containing protein n=1 Tax=Actinomadura sp. NPDC047616 TaxID=3155914 RepID=UPI0033F950FE
MRRHRLLTAVTLTAACMTGAPIGADASRSSDDPPPDTGPASPRSGVVTGRVLTRSGAPVAGCAVVPEATSRPRPPVPEMAVLSDADGRYRWPLPRATYDLTARCPDARGSGRVTRVTVRPGEETVADIVLG